MEDRLWRIEDDIFSDIYLYDSRVRDKIESLIASEECVQLVEKAEAQGNVLPLLDEVIRDKKSHPIPKFMSLLNPFYSWKEYRTKEDYLQYLKQAYGFMLSPLEIPPGRIVSIFFPHYGRTWSPSPESALELLKKFYVEVNLINDLTPLQWKKVASATNPEMMMAKMLYGTRFKPEFENLLKRIPWILSSDVYGSPGLDLIYRRAPGHEMPKKPFGVGESYLSNLVKASLTNQAYTLLPIGDEKVRLTDKIQITSQIEAEGTAQIDSFVGLSKIEHDFVIHRHIIIWQNPGYERYQKASFFDRLRFAKPSRFLCVIREKALPLEIPFLKRNPNKARK
ncbi:MAG: hypothetical protein V3U20_06975 [Thermoplasmata archaeon]